MLPRPLHLPLLALAAALGCGSSETSSGGGGTVVGNPGLTISAPPGCVTVPTDRPASVPITIEPTKSLTLQPPGTCAATERCGYVLLSVIDADGNAVPNNAGSSLVIELFSTPEKPLSGTVDVKAEVLKDDGTALLGADDKAVTAMTSFVAKASCDGTGGGGTGGTTTSTGGTGGTGGTTTSTSGTGGSTSSGGTGGTGGTTSGTGGTGGTTTSTGGSSTGGMGGTGAMPSSGSGMASSGSGM